MKTKTETPQPKCVVQQLEQIPLTDTTRSEIGQNISFALDLMNDPRFKENNFRQIEKRNLRNYHLHASNDEITVHFSIEWKGGTL